jgi:hypothetical protein
MAGNKKQRKKKKKVSTQRQPVKSQTRRRMSISQMAFIAFGVIIILSMVISLFARSGYF